MKLLRKSNKFWNIKILEQSGESFVESLKNLTKRLFLKDDKNSDKFQEKLRNYFYVLFILKSALSDV